MALQIDDRPTSFDDIVGNELTLKCLSKVISRKKGRPKGYLITGPSGCVKLQSLGSWVRCWVLLGWTCVK